MSQADRLARPEFQQGGGKPHLFYAAFGPIPDKWSVSGSAYKTRGIPDGVELSMHGKEGVDHFCEGLMWDQFCASHPEQAKATQSQRACIVLKGEVQDDSTLHYLQDCIGFIQWFLDAGGVSVYDPYAIQWHTPEEWKARLFDDNASPVGPHTTILCSEEPDGLWLHTRGMIKFGRPDLSLPGITPENRQVATELIQRMIGFQARGGVFENGAELNIKGGPKGLTCWHGGSMDDPDFNNVHLTIRWPQ